MYGEKNGGGGARNVKKAPTSIATGGGWADLLPELVRRVGKLQGNPRSLARMERTCKSWRNVIIEGDGTVDMGDDPCPWRELALAKFPRLVSIVNVVTETGSVSGAVLSWKALYKSHFLAKSFSERGTSLNSQYQQRGGWNDYVTTVEFRRENELLFVASGRGDRTSPLWNQSIEFDDDNNKIICKGSLDSELSSRLGVNPFSSVNLRNITARVVVTRLSDLGVVELGSAAYDHTDDDGLIQWSHVETERAFLPIEIITRAHGGEPAYLFSESIRMKFWILPSDGTVVLAFQSLNSDNGTAAGDLYWQSMTEEEEMLYLEKQCPWP